MHLKIQLSLAFFLSGFSPTFLNASGEFKDHVASGEVNGLSSKAFIKVTHLSSGTLS